MATTNPRTAAAVVRHLNIRFPQDDLLAICYQDDQREGYFVRVTVDEPEGVVLPLSCSNYRDWFDASMTAVTMLPIITREVEALLAKRAEVLSR